MFIHELPLAYLSLYVTIPKCHSSRIVVMVELCFFLRMSEILVEMTIKHNKVSAGLRVAEKAIA
jgi:hypothetical protein